MDIDKIISIIREHKINEMVGAAAVSGGPTNAMNKGAIAGSVEAGDDPPIDNKKRKRYIYQKNTRKQWLQK